MKLVLLFQVVASILLAVLVATQLIMPAIRGTKLFPMLRREGKLLKEVEDAKQEEREQKIERKLNKIKDKIK